MSAKAHAGPVSRLLGIREGLAPLSEGGGEFVGEMRVASTMARALREA